MLSHAFDSSLENHRNQAYLLTMLFLNVDVSYDFCKFSLRLILTKLQFCKKYPTIWRNFPTTNDILKQSPYLLILTGAFFKMWHFEKTIMVSLPCINALCEDKHMPFFLKGLDAQKRSRYRAISRA
jgi:hypothetical protein